MIYSLTDVPGGRWSWEELPQYNLQNFCKAGINLVQVDLALDHIWKPDGSIDLNTTQRQLRGVIDGCPHAAIFIRLHVSPPKWWQEKYIEELTIYADTVATPDINWGLQRIIEDDEETPRRTSIASLKWQQEATTVLKKFLKKLVLLPEANALAGIQVAGGVYGEWHYWGFINNEPDMSKPMNDFFRLWLTKKYLNNKALQKAWNDPEVLLNTTTLPTLAQRKITGSGIFRNPPKERKIIDYYESQHSLIAETILHFCKVIKETWPRPIITGAFYGYFYSVFGRETAGGHLQLQQVLNSPHIDYLSGPGTYYPQAVETGDPYRSRSLINSVTIHGKLWLDEMDQQPPLLPLKDLKYPESLLKSIANTRRNLLATYTKGQGLWFYDFGPSGFNGGPRLKDHGSFGWWDEPSLMKDIRQLKKLFDDKMTKPYTNDADVLLVHSTETFYYTGSDKKQSYMGHWANNWVPPAIYRSGVVHDIIHIDDLEKISLDRYKAIVFVNAWMITPSKRLFIENNVSSGDRHLVWLYTAGYCDGATLNKSFVESLTGIKMKIIAQKEKTIIEIVPEISKEPDLSVWDNSVNPLFVSTDPSAKVFGQVKGSGLAGFVMKSFKNHTSWFISLPPADAELWRYIFKTAGAHIYNESGDIFYSGGGLFSIHTSKGGNRNIKLKNGKLISIVLPVNSTTILDSEDGLQLMLNGE